MGKIESKVKLYILSKEQTEMKATGLMHVNRVRIGKQKIWKFIICYYSVWSPDLGFSRWAYLCSSWTRRDLSESISLPLRSPRRHWLSPPGIQSVLRLCVPMKKRKKGKKKLAWWQWLTVSKSHFLTDDCQTFKYLMFVHPTVLTSMRHAIDMTH